MAALPSPTTLRPTTFLGGESLPTNEECNVILDYVDRINLIPPTNMTSDLRAQRNDFFCDYLVLTLDNVNQLYKGTHKTASSNTIRSRQKQYGWPTKANLKNTFVAAIACSLTRFRECGEFEIPAELISKISRNGPSETPGGLSTPSPLRENGKPSSCPTENYDSPLGPPLSLTPPFGIYGQHQKGRSPRADVESGPFVRTISLHTKSSGDENHVAVSPADDHPERPPFQRNMPSQLLGKSHLSRLSVDSGYDTMDSKHSSIQSGVSVSYGISSPENVLDGPHQVPNGWNDNFSNRYSYGDTSSSTETSSRLSNDVGQMPCPVVHAMSHAKRFTFKSPPQNMLHNIVSSPLPLPRCLVCSLEIPGNSESRLHQIECAIAAGCPTNSVNRGLTPLHALLCSNREEFSSLAEGPATTFRLAKELLCRSTDPYAHISALSSEGKTALYLAAERGYDLVVAHFLEICPDQARAMANVCDSRGTSILMAANIAFQIAFLNNDEVLMNRCYSVSVLLKNCGGDHTVSEKEIL